MWSDVDDALALGMLHALHDRNEIDLLAITLSTDEGWSAAYTRLLNDFYGHSSIPVGMGGLDTETLRENMEPVLRKLLPEMTWPISRYTQEISERHGRRSSSAPQAVELLRQVLARQPDRSVVVVQVGYSTNLARLLESKPDAASRSSGRDLVDKKVRMLVTMAGNFREATHEGKTLRKGATEINLLADVAAARKLFADWPTPIVASGSEIGFTLRFPRSSAEHDFGYVKDHPVAEAYRVFCEDVKVSLKWPWSCPQEHATADLTAVLYAARPDRNYFSVSKPGKITVLADGGSRFEELAGATHQHLILSDDQKARTVEAMVMLATQPPVRASQR